MPSLHGGDCPAYAFRMVKVTKVTREAVMTDAAMIVLLTASRGPYS
jgi:hypothetical protein